MVKLGKFRADLLFRLNVVTIMIPPLRERVEEIEPLATRFLERAAAMLNTKFRGVEPAALEMLKKYEWPGNIRELRNTIDRAAVLANDGIIRAQDLSLRSAGTIAPPSPGEEEPHGLDFRSRVRRFESDLILQALEAC